MFVACGVCVFNRVRFRKAEYASAIRSLADLATPELSNSLHWSVYTTVMDLVAPKYPLGNHFVLPERTYLDRSGVELDWFWTETELLHAYGHVPSCLLGINRVFAQTSKLTL